MARAQQLVKPTVLLARPALLLLLLSALFPTGAAAAAALTIRARQVVEDAGQHALHNAQPEFSVYHLAFVLFDARGTRSVVDPTAGPSPLNRLGSMGAHVAGEAGADQLEISHRLERAAARAVESVEPAPTRATPTEDLKAALVEADRVRLEEAKDAHVGLHHLLLAVAQHDGVGSILKAAGLGSKLLKQTVAGLRGAPIDSVDAESDKFAALLTYLRRTTYKDVAYICRYLHTIKQLLHIYYAEQVWHRSRGVSAARSP